jgi:hypothetical protein
LAFLATQFRGSVERTIGVSDLSISTLRKGSWMGHPTK